MAAAEKLLVERRLERTQALIHGFQLSLLCERKLGARVDETLIIYVEQLRLLGVEAKACLMVVEIFEALKQLRIEIDEVAVSSEKRRGLGVDRLKSIIGVGTVDCGKGKTDALQKEA